MLKIRLLMRTLALAAFAIFILPAVSASAIAVTGSTITTPADKTILLPALGSQNPKYNIAGAVTGTFPGAQVDIRCYARATYYNTVQAGVDVSSGSFSLTDVTTPTRQNCVLRAVPAGSSPADLSPFTGPWLVFDANAPSTDGPSLYDYYVYAGQLSGAMDYFSFGGCGIDYGHLYDPLTHYRTTDTFFCNGWVEPRNSATNGSSLIVDGKNTYAPGSVNNLLHATPGFQPLTYNTIFAANGDLTTTESNPTFACNNNADTYNSLAGCTQLIDAGVTVKRSIAQDHDGLQSRIVDQYVNNTGATKTLTVSYDEEFCMSGAACARAATEVDFPGKSPIVNGANSTHVDGPFGTAPTIYVKRTDVADGDLGSGRASVTYFPGFDYADYRNDNGSAYTDFYVTYANRTIPPNGALTIKHAYSQSFTQSQLDQLVADGGKAIVDQPTLNKLRKPKAKRSRKGRVSLDTGQTIMCPALGDQCSTASTLTAKVKLPSAHKTSTAKTKYKTYKLGNVKTTVAAGKTTKTIVFSLSKKNAKLLKRRKKLKTTLTVKIAAGPFVSFSKAVTLTFKNPR